VPAGVDPKGGVVRGEMEEVSGALPAPPVPRTALVTGGGRRIGRALALALAEDGFAVAVHYHQSQAAAEAVVAAIREAGGAAVALGADLADEDAVRDLLPQAERAFGSVGCLVNNAGVFGNDTLATVTRESWDRHLAVNLRAPFVLIQEMAARLPDGAGGVVVNMLDERVWSLTPYFMSYTLSKSGLWTLTRTLALALAPRIRVNGIGPGPTLPSPRQTAEQFRRQYRQMPLGRGTSPQEIGAALHFILAAPAMTGQMIALDGGQHLGWAQPVRDPTTE
jgi:NAD(P)-dependent dehydrogenase (short-subunit alcohol dehydrogenase family)